MIRWVRWPLWCGVVVVLTSSVPLRAAAPVGSQAPADPMSEPAAYGIRFTPGMARAIARQMTEQGIVRRYELDPARQDEVTEMVAGRFMEMFKSFDTLDGQQNCERLFGAVLKTMTEAHRSPTRGIPPQAVEVGKEMLPLMPAIQQFVRNVGQDVRPMLPMKQQLKLAGDLAAVKMTLDSFETCMQRWSSGDVDPDDNPFDPNSSNRPDENGVTPRVKKAREKLARDPVKVRTEDWDSYVKDAKEFYGFDEAQCATADSILREAKLRAAGLEHDVSWVQHRTAVRFWETVRSALGRAFRSDEHPLAYMVSRRGEKLNDPIGLVFDDLRQRIDRIPREEQRRAADQRLTATLVELGLQPTEGQVGDANR